METLLSNKWEIHVVTIAHSIALYCAALKEKHKYKYAIKMYMFNIFSLCLPVLITLELTWSCSIYDLAIVLIKKCITQKWNNPTLPWLKWFLTDTKTFKQNNSVMLLYVVVMLYAELGFKESLYLNCSSQAYISVVSYPLFSELKRWHFPIQF